MIPKKYKELVERRNSAIEHLQKCMDCKDLSITGYDYPGGRKQLTEDLGCLVGHYGEIYDEGYEFVYKNIGTDSQRDQAMNLIIDFKKVK